MTIMVIIVIHIAIVIIVISIIVIIIIIIIIVIMNIIIVIVIIVCRQLETKLEELRGNHLSNTTCLTQVFFKRGKSGSESWRSLTRQSTKWTNEAVLDKQR